VRDVSNIPIRKHETLPLSRITSAELDVAAYPPCPYVPYADRQFQWKYVD
jgi:hypothetical protein